MEDRQESSQSSQLCLVVQDAEGAPGTHSPTASMSPKGGLSPRSSVGSEIDTCGMTDTSGDSLLDRSSDTDFDMGERKREGSCDSAVVVDNNEAWGKEEEGPQLLPIKRPVCKKRSLSMVAPPDLSLLEVHDRDKVTEVPVLVVTDHDAEQGIFSNIFFPN